MSFHSLMAVHLKEEVERLLKNSSLTNEHHTDQVLLALYPDCMYVVLYTIRPVTMKQYLTENGFVAETNNNPNNTTMVYKDIVNIKVMTDQAEYDSEKIRNFKIFSINLNHVVKQMAKNGYKLPQMYTDLEKLTTFK